MHTSNVVRPSNRDGSVAQLAEALLLFSLSCGFSPPVFSSPHLCRCQHALTLPVTSMSYRVRYIKSGIFHLSWVKYLCLSPCLFAALFSSGVSEHRFWPIAPLHRTVQAMAILASTECVLLPSLPPSLPFPLPDDPCASSPGDAQHVRWQRFMF